MNKKAHWQSRDNVTGAIRDQHVQSRTHVWNATREKLNKKHLKINTYNPQSISDLNTQDLEIMLVEIEKMHWDIIGLSGTQIKENTIEVLPSGHQLFNSGNETSRSNGTGFLVHKSITHIISDYQGISDRLAVLSLQGKDNKIVFIQVYLPPLDHPDEEIENLYSQIQELIDKIPQRDFVFIMGDFNARIGGVTLNLPTMHRKA